MLMDETVCKPKQPSRGKGSYDAVKA